MQMIRTTIPLPVDVHQEWRMEALLKKVTLGELILEKAGVKKKKNSRMNIDRQIEKDFAYFDKIGRSGLEIDAVAAVREDRNRDDA